MIFFWTEGVRRKEAMAMGVRANVRTKHADKHEERGTRTASQPAGTFNL
jgi:hypothetical protein